MVTFYASTSSGIFCEVGNVFLFLFGRCITDSIQVEGGDGVGWGMGGNVVMSFLSSCFFLVYYNDHHLFKKNVVNYICHVIKLKDSKRVHVVRKQICLMLQITQARLYTVQFQHIYILSYCNSPVNLIRKFDLWKFKKSILLVRY